MIHDYSKNSLGLKDKVAVFNPHPYPVTITHQGHSLGGRETAIVLRVDPCVVKALEVGDVILAQEQPEPAKPTKTPKPVQADPDTEASS